MTNKTFLRSAPFFSSLLLLVACSGGDGGPKIILPDAAPDGPTTPDAPPFVCEQTECGNECVDLTTNPNHCGECNAACPSPGHICTGQLPCECPSNFVPAEAGQSGFDQVMEQGGTNIAIAPIVSGALHILAVTYDPGTETGVALDLAGNLENLSSPIVAAGYEVDTANFTAKTAYASVSGSITFETACASGASGTITNLELVEVGAVQAPVPVPNGCTQSYKSISFNIGEACPKDPGATGKQF